MSAAEAAAAVERGWRRGAPGDDPVLRPLADGGTGFVEVLHAALGGTLHRLDVTGPLGDPVSACWLEHDGTGYVESAQACGLHLVDASTRQAGLGAERSRRDPGAATSRGVGELLAAVAAAGIGNAVVGLGGSATSDGGAGMLAALGAIPVDGAAAPLPDGGAPLARCAQLDGRPGLDGLTLVVAADVTNPLLGRHGAAHVFGPQKGADAAEVQRLETALTRWADVLEAATGRAVREEPGAGAAGGLGAALLALGASPVSGAALVRERTGLDRALDSAQLVVTGEGSFDRQSLRGKLVTALASGAAERGVRCIVLAGQVSVGQRDAAAVGVDAAYAAADVAGSAAAALADPAGSLETVAEQAARRWGGR